MGRALIIVAGDGALSEQLTSGLRSDGHVVTVATTLVAARLLHRLHPAELIVVDRDLPDGDGLLLCEEGRRDGDRALMVVLAASGGAVERIECLRAGADDCLQRPLDVAEIRLRISSMMRRLHRDKPVEDASKGEPIAQPEPIVLTPRECSLLACLVERASQPITPAALLSRKWALTFEPRSGKLGVERGRERDQPPHHSDVFAAVTQVPPRTGKTRSRS